MFIQRDLQQKILSFLNAPEIILILGPRQSGKSTLINHISGSLESVNILTFEDPDLLNLFEHDINAFAELYVKGNLYVFLDEVQYAKSFGKHMKYLYDRFSGKTKFVLTGSSATSFYLNGLKYLVGRVFIFNLFPLSLKEFIRYKNNKLLNIAEHKFITEEINRLIMEFIIYGGYPRVVTAETAEEKKEVLKNIYSNLIQREITDLAKLLDQYKVINLVRLLSLQTGSLVNLSNLALESGFKVYQLKHVLEILQNTFTFKTIQPFYTNKRLEVIKNPKIYPIDTGLRNTIINDFSELRTDRGILFESLVFQELIKQGFDVNFWRSKSGAEVDFVIRVNSQTIPIEVKSGIAKVSRSFKSFIERYKPKSAYILNNVEIENSVLNKTTIKKAHFIQLINMGLN